MSVVTESDLTRIPRLVNNKRNRATSFQSDSNDTDPAINELYSALRPAQMSAVSVLPKSLHPCKVCDAFVNTSKQGKDEEYLWRIFSHIKTMGNKLQYYNSELKRYKAENDKTRKELEESKKELVRQVEETNRATQCKKYAENKASEIEQI